MAQLMTRALSPDTWDDFAALVERNNGVWGGCWCVGFHADADKSSDHRLDKQALVGAGRTHAALVYEDDRCVGWCQFGSPAELPKIKYRKAYEAGSGAPPDWRITCFFTDKAGRRRGVGEAALAGALAEIARLGGGRVESSPEDTTGRKPSSSFLFNGTLAMFEAAGFHRERQLGKHAWLVAKDVAQKE